MDALTITVIVVAALGALGTVADIVALVRHDGARLALSAIVLRVLGVLVLIGLTLAGRGRPDFQDLVFIVYGILGGVALWIAALVVDVVLVVRHPAWRRGA